MKTQTKIYSDKTAVTTTTAPIMTVEKLYADNAADFGGTMGVTMYGPF